MVSWPDIGEQRLLARLRGLALALTRSKRGLFGIGAASFLESIIIPIPFEAVMMPMMLADRQRIWIIATVTTLGSLVGALVGYAVGYFLFESVGQWFLQAMGYSEQFAVIRQKLIEQGGWIILTIGIAPIPSQIAMLGSGVVAYPLLSFLALMAVARGLRYFGLALLVWHFGSSTEKLIKRHKRGAQIVVWSLLVMALIYCIVLFSG